MCWLSILQRARYAAGCLVARRMPSLPYRQHVYALLWDRSGTGLGLADDDACCFSAKCTSVVQARPQLVNFVHALWCNVYCASIVRCAPTWLTGCPSGLERSMFACILHDICAGCKKVWGRRAAVVVATYQEAGLVYFWHDLGHTRWQGHSQCTAVCACFGTRSCGAS